MEEGEEEEAKERNRERERERKGESFLDEQAMEQRNGSWLVA